MESNMQGKKNEASRSEPLVIAMDVGTSSLKAGVVDPRGTLLQYTRIPFNLKQDGPLETQSTDIWIEGLKAAVREFGDTSGVAAVAISGNGPTVVPVDERGIPLDEASLWLNKRDERIEGQSSFFLPKIAWIKAKQADIYRKARWYLGCPEFLSFYLTGEVAAFSPSGEFDQYIWDEAGMAAYGIDKKTLPPIIKTGESMGRITADAAAEAGLPAGIPVVATGADFLMSLVGTGATKPGRTCDRTGTSEGINCCCDHKIQHERIRCLPHAIEGLYNIAGILSSTGRIFEWFRRFSGQAHRPYSEMMQEISTLPWSTDLPHFYPSLHRGEVWEFSKGVFTNLEAHHGPAEMGRAVVSSIGFGIRDLIETLENHGCSIESLRISGGQGRSEIWNRMKANITGKVVEVPHIIDAEIAGSAAAAFTALGLWPSLGEAAEDLVKMDIRYEPDLKLNRRYTEEYEDYTYHCDRIIAALADK